LSQFAGKEDVLVVMDAQPENNQISNNYWADFKLDIQ